MIVCKEGIVIAKSRKPRAPFERFQDSTNINEDIESLTVRLIDQEKQNHGVVPLQKALSLAREAGLDLVEISPNAEPPVCRIMEYSKFKYEKQKREKASRQGSQSKQTKEIRLSLKISEHDLQIKVTHAREFLDKGHRVQMTMRFKGRENRYADSGFGILKQVTTMMADVAKVEFGPHREGGRMYLLLAPGLPSKKINENPEANAAEAPVTDAAQPNA